MSNQSYQQTTNIKLSNGSLLDTILSPQAITSPSTGDVMPFLRLTALKSALDAVELPPNTTTLQIKNKLKLVNNTGGTSDIDSNINNHLELQSSNDIVLNPTGIIDATGKTLTCATLNYTSLNPPILSGFVPVIASRQIEQNTNSSVINTGINILSVPSPARQTLIHPDTNCSLVNAGTQSAGIRVNTSGSYKVEMYLTFDTSSGAGTNQYVGLQIGRGISYTPFTTPNPNSVITQKQNLLPNNNNKLEQSCGGVCELSAGEVVSFWFNPNSQSAGGAVAVSASIGTTCSVFRIS